MATAPVDGGEKGRQERILDAVELLQAAVVGRAGQAGAQVRRGGGVAGVRVGRRGIGSRRCAGLLSLIGVSGMSPGGAV